MSDILKCLFPVAGYGTRFLPATKAMPKEMLPILNKPLIEYGVSEAKEAGCTTMAMVTGRNKRAIEDHFDKNYEVKLDIFRYKSFISFHRSNSANVCMYMKDRLKLANFA